MLLTYKTLFKPDDQTEHPTLRSASDKPGPGVDTVLPLDTLKRMARAHGPGWIMKLSGEEEALFNPRYIQSGILPQEFKTREFRIVEAELSNDHQPHEGVTFWCEPV